jgi:hypothetical protein
MIVLRIYQFKLQVKEGGRVLTRWMFPGVSLRWIAARMTCVTAISGCVMMGRMEHDVPS